MKRCVFFALMLLVMSTTSCHRHSIHSAAGYQNFNDVKGFVNKGADVNAKDGYGNTPLLIAVQYSNYTIAKYLIDNGADVNSQNNEGWTALNYAVYYGGDALAKLLIEKHASVNIANN